ncbi:hypothetical protein [Paracoccus xiamenensis]|uniref:hypothetical protein n=1 Tax=Paracoccus xiamenensis TaxID=2714901 RepID=UPI00140B60F0|nr:hypothetical protein [Paracoccus xiamenensis]NHF73180.1 hypothetical protein [Paracoccus xiamenensis]
MDPIIIRAEGARVTLYPDGPDWQGAPAATLGNFSSKDAAGGRVVLAQALTQARALGIRQLIGPMEGDTWHSYRFITESDDSPPFLLEPTNKPHEPALFTEAGFQPIGRYFSARVALNQTADNPPPAPEGFTITPWSGADPEALFGQVFDLSVEAFSRNAFYKPISRQAFLAMYMPVVPLMKRELIFFATTPKGRLMGFLFGIPNYAEGPQTKTVILKTYASLMPGAGRHLAHAFHSAARALGYDTAIHALIHEDNLSALRSAVEGAQVFRRYTLFGLRLA